MKTLILLHGFLGTPDDFSTWTKSFPKTRVLPLHLSPNLTHASLKKLAENIFVQLQHAGIIQAHFAGYSLGGRVLLELYKLHPEVFESLTLMSSSLGIHEPQEKPPRLKKDQDWAKLLASNPQLFLQKWYEQELFSQFKQMPGFEKRLEIRKKNLTPNHAKLLVDASPAANPDHYDLVSQIQVPVLVLVGELDVKYRNLWSNLIAKLPGFKLKIIANTGHVVHLENPSDTMTEILEFINQELK
jgi:2-succinyl-6-hydroxy-2,4-cyclohexadiene-1-carboxylate synthase